MTDFSKVPTAPDFEQEEPTPITDMRGMFKALEQVKAVSQRLVKHDMPQIAKDAKLACNAAQEASQQVIVVRTRQEDFSKRLEGMERKGHPCVQQAEITRLKEQSHEWRQDKEEGIKTREMVCGVQEKISAAVEALDKTNTKIEKTEKRPNRILAGVLSVGLGLIVVFLGGAWRLSADFTSVQASIVTEAKVRETEFESLKERIAELPSKRDVPSPEQVKHIERVVVENGHSFAARCNKLTKAQKQRLARQVATGVLPDILLCPE